MIAKPFKNLMDRPIPKASSYTPKAKKSFNPLTEIRIFRLTSEQGIIRRYEANFSRGTEVEQYKAIKVRLSMECEFRKNHRRVKKVRSS